MWVCFCLVYIHLYHFWADFLKDEIRREIILFLFCLHLLKYLSYGVLHTFHLLTRCLRMWTLPQLSYSCLASILVFSLLSLYGHWDVHKQLWVSCSHILPSFIVHGLILSARLCYPVFLSSISRFQGGSLKTIKPFLLRNYCLTLAAWWLTTSDLIFFFFNPIAHIVGCLYSSSTSMHWVYVLLKEAILKRTLPVSPALTCFSLQKKKKKVYFLERLLGAWHPRKAATCMVVKYPGQETKILNL